uniref:G_PROTEIN_RECEP_F1_2 domain-containing protein n=1 Tax=Rhabditophanes sp. KR3021 TaxID=114890 RepID=A0AC35U3M9_9BILA
MDMIQNVDLLGAEEEELLMELTPGMYTSNISVVDGNLVCEGFPKGFAHIFQVRVIYLMLYFIIFVVAVTGNTLVVYVVMTKKSMQTVTNIFITNLAISDLLVNFTSLWLTPLYTFMGHWIWGGWLCYGLPLFQGTSIFISTLTLTAIALDRYFVICHHGTVKVNATDHISMHVCVGIITVIWAFSLLLVMPYAVHMRLHYVQKPCDFWLCLETWTMNDLKSAYGLIVMVLQFIVPLLIIAYSYIQIWRFLNNRRSLVTARESEIETQRKKHLLRMLVIMVAVFGACWFPFNLLNMIRDLGLDYLIKKYFPPLYITSHLISMTATCWNPIVYAWMNESFRREFIHVIPLFKRCFSNTKRPSNHRVRVITDCQPAAIRVNCKEAKKMRFKKGDPLSYSQVDFTEAMVTSSTYPSHSLSATESLTISHSFTNGSEDVLYPNYHKLILDTRNGKHAVIQRHHSTGDATPLIDTNIGSNVDTQPHTA